MKLLTKLFGCIFHVLLLVLIRLYFLIEYCVQKQWIRNIILLAGLFGWLYYGGCNLLSMIFGKISLCPIQRSWFIQIIVGIITPFVLLRFGYWIYNKSNNSSHWNRPTYPQNIPIYSQNVHHYTPPYEYPYVPRRNLQNIPQNVLHPNPYLPPYIPPTKPQIDPQQESGDNKL